MVKPFLKGWHIVIMRAPHQSAALAQMVREHQGEPHLLPMQEILPIPVSVEQEQQWLRAIKASSLILVTSANAVYHAPASLLHAMNGGQTVVTMGKATTQALSDNGVNVFFTAPGGSTSESLLEHAFLQEQNVRHKNFILLAGEGGRTVLAECLENRGAQVKWLKVYRQQLSQYPIENQLCAWQQHQRLCFTSTSSRSLANLLMTSPVAYHPWLKDQRFIVVSARIATQAKAWGFQHIFEAKAAHPEAILVALQEMVLNKNI